MPVAAENIKDLPGMTPETSAKLEGAGFMKSIQLMGLNAEALMGIEGISAKDAALIEKALKGDTAEAKPVEKVEEKKTEENKTEAKLE